jgi:hypothetical protein
LQDFENFAGLQLGVRRTVEQSDRHRGIADGFDQARALRGQWRFAVAGMKSQRRLQSGHADGQRPPVAGDRTQLAELIEPGVGDAAADVPGAPTRQGAWRDAHCHPVHVVGRQPISHVPCALPPPACRANVAVGRPHTRAHVPAERFAQITGCFQMIRDERGVLLDRSGVSLFDRGGEPSVHARAL